jgi:hypothetical protein
MGEAIMSGSKTSKIERIHTRENLDIWVDLCLDKDSGLFWALVGNERIEEKTKESAVSKIREALAKLQSVHWRQVIIVTVPKDRATHSGMSNGIPQHGASCSLAYERVERSPNPMRKKEEIERVHPIDFEKKIKEAIERVRYWEKNPLKRKTQSDEAEAALRQSRLTLNGSHARWDRENMVEYEIPYSDAAWLGIERIAETLRLTQRRLDDFAAEWTPESLAALGVAPDAGAAKLLFLPAAKKRSS